jgi:hypothetical protein
VPRSSTNNRTQRAPLDVILIGVLVAGGLFLRWRVPAFIIPSSPKDDLLGVRLASSIFQGDWLGSWTQDTLAKPPGYSIFLATCHWFDVNPVLLMYSIYLTVSIVGIKFLGDSYLRSQTSKRYFKLFGSFFLIFNPLVFSNDFSRIYRTALETLLIFIAILLLSVILSRFSLASRLIKKAQVFRIERNLEVWLLLFGFGLVMGYAKITRVESDWFFFAGVLFMCLMFLLSFWKRQKTTFLIRNLFVVVTVSVFSFLIPVVLVSAVNQNTYGKFQIENYFTGNFSLALNLWAGVESGTEKLNGVTINTRQRSLVYAISPTAKSLEMYLEQPANTGYRLYNCQATGICEESGSWFPWEIRDAAIKTGVIQNEMDFQDFFGKIAKDIDMGCRSGKIKCSRPGYAPATNDLKSYINLETVSKTFRIMISYPSFIGGQTYNRVDNGHDPSDLALWKSIVRFHYPVPFQQSDFDLKVVEVLMALKTVFEVLFAYLLLFLVIDFFVKFRKFDETKFLTTFLMLCLGIFSFGIAIFETAMGHRPHLHFYTLPGQSIVTWLAILGLLRNFQLKPLTNQSFRIFRS